MPAALALPAFWGAVSAGVGGGATIAGAKMQSSANKTAAKLQASATDRALDYEKEQDTYNRSRQTDLDRRAQKQLDYENRTAAEHYAGRGERMAPYVSAGGGSADRQAQLLGLPARPAMPVAGPVAGSVATAAGGAARPAVQPIRDAGAPPIVPGGPPADGAAPTVMLQAPDGSTKAVPAEQEAYWVSRGAKRVAA